MATWKKQNRVEPSAFNQPFIEMVVASYPLYPGEWPFDTGRQYAHQMGKPVGAAAGEEREQAKKPIRKKPHT